MKLKIAEWDSQEMNKLFEIPSTDGGRKTEQTKEPQPTPAAEAGKKEQPEDKKVHSNHVLVAFKKPRSHSLIPVYVRANAQSYNLWAPASLG